MSMAIDRVLVAGSRVLARVKNGLGVLRSPANLWLLIVLAGSAALRVTFLGYSHYQGDEIKAVYPADAPFPAYLFQQTKGPVQYLVTRGVAELVTSAPEWLMRLPFAMASLASVYVAYRLVREAFGGVAASFAGALMGGCGLLVAFGRIVQYQSILILLLLLTATYLFRWYRTGSRRALYVCAVCYAAALLTHWDAISFGPTLVAGTVLGGARHSWSRPVRGSLSGALAIVLGVAGAFYLPYISQPAFVATREYLISRVVRVSDADTSASSAALLGLYVPPFYLVIAAVLLTIGGLHTVRRRDTTGRLIVFWFLTTFIAYSMVVTDPRSHVYVYFVPGLLLVAVGIDVLREAVSPPLARAAVTAVAGSLLLASGAATYYMVVDHSREHPWEEKALFGIVLPNLISDRMDGVFGFPYYRGLEQLGDLFQSGVLRGTIRSNEREALVDHYVRAPRAVNSDYYIHVLMPQSLIRELPGDIAAAYRLVWFTEARGRRTIELYARPGAAGP